MGVPITFVECQTSGYKARTKQNILETDGTLAIYVDGTTAGEKLTKLLALQNKKPFFEFPLLDIFSASDVLHQIGNWLYENHIFKLNVAGNGLYTFKRLLPKYNQSDIDDLVDKILSKSVLGIDHIQSGGQSGIDEAAIKYGINHGLETRVVAPKGWIYRDEYNVDHSGKAKFHKRFMSHIVGAAEGADTPERD